jgi:YD repeat-containing protein
VTSWAGDVLTWVSGATDQKSITITSMAAGNISVEGHYNSLPDGKTYSFNYSLSGPVNESGNLCASGCGDPSSATFTGMPAGTYTLYVTPSSNGPASLFFMISYPITVDSPATSGEKNYFYDGFEENDDVHVVNGQAHTGNKYWSNNAYNTSFIPPDNGTYRIEWWSLSGGNWRYNQQQYTSGMVLTGPVDDVRICPANALMSTYTYQPMAGMTSEIDPKGFTTYYSYDPFDRLTLVRDKDNNIIKRFCYNLAGQQQSCPFVK